MSPSELVQVMGRRKKLRSEAGHSDLCLWDGLPNDFRMPRLVNKNKSKAKVASPKLPTKRAASSPAHRQDLLSHTRTILIRVDTLVWWPLTVPPVLPRRIRGVLVQFSEPTDEMGSTCDVLVDVGANVGVSLSSEDLDNSTEADQMRVNSAKGSRFL